MKKSNFIRIALVSISLLFFAKFSLNAQNGVLLKGAIGLSTTPPIASNYSIVPFGSVVFVTGNKIKTFVDIGFQHGGGERYRTSYITANPSFRYYYQNFYGGLGGYASLDVSVDNTFDYGYSLHFGYGKEKIISINLQQGLWDIGEGSLYDIEVYKNRYIYLSYHHMIINAEKKKLQKKKLP